MFFNPLTFLFMVIFFLLVLFFFIIIQVNVIVLAFAKIGIPSHYIFTALFAILLGSFINIPVKKIPQDSLLEERWVSFFGFRHAIPAGDSYYLTVELLLSILRRALKRVLIIP